MYFAQICNIYVWYFRNRLTNQQSQWFGKKYASTDVRTFMVISKFSAYILISIPLEKYATWRENN